MSNGVDKVKPQVARVVLPSGEVRFFGIRAAAAWLGCTPGALGACVRLTPGRGERLRNRAREEFPEFFAAAEGEGGAQ
jgi:hypothetical protein